MKFCGTLSSIFGHSWSMGAMFQNCNKKEIQNGDWLVVWNIFYFPCHIWDVILPIDEVHHFFRGVGIPPTSYIIFLDQVLITNNHY